ncbi:MATE family efflux transporter [Gemmiger sp.]
MRTAGRILRSNVDMTQGEPLTVIFSFALPLLVGNLFNQLYNVVDTAIVGRAIGADALAAVGSTGNINACLFLLLGGLATGVSVIVSQYWGAQKYDALRRLLGTFLVLLLAGSAVMSLLGVALATPLLRLLQVPTDLLPMGVTYLRITAGLLLGNALYNAAGAVLRSTGDSRTPLAAMAASSICNIALDLWFILGLHMGVAGAALATVAAQFLSAAICLGVLWRRRAPFAFASVRLCFNRDDAALILRFGLPTALQSCMISLGGMTVQGLVNSFGSVTMAAYTAVQRIDSLTIQVVVSVSNALAIYTGQNMGRHDVARVRRGLRATLKALFGICLVLAMAVFASRRLLLSIFLDPATDAASIAQGADFLSVMGFAYVIAAVMNSYLNVLRGAGDVNVSLIAGLFEMGARLAFAYALAPHLGVWGIWLATPLSWASGCIIPVARYYSKEWMKKALL